MAYTSVGEIEVVGVGRIFGCERVNLFHHWENVITLAQFADNETCLCHALEFVLKSYGPTYQYFAKVTKEEYKQRSLIGLIDKYFDNSYLSAVSALVKEEKITIEELKELIDLVEKGEQK